ncbi:MAG: hypothetical protein R3B74_15925 [Nitrospirales bacterium]|nr:hypothetical protein [Nitrospirales bacterium]
MAVVDFPPMLIGPVMIECLAARLSTVSGKVRLCVSDKPVLLGTKVLYA